MISDIMGRSGRRMIEAMIAGQRDPRKLAALADRRVKATPKELYDALHGRLTDHHRFLLKLHIGQWDTLDASIQAVDREVDARIARLNLEAGPIRPDFPSDRSARRSRSGFGSVAQLDRAAAI